MHEPGAFHHDVAAAIDTRVDSHTHSDWTDGADSIDDMADAAVAAGLRTWGLSDHVRHDTTWLPEYVTAVRALRRDDLLIRCGVETKIMNVSGQLDLPPSLPALDYLLIADHQFPGVDGPEHPSSVRDRLAAGQVTPSAVVEQLVEATAAALRSSPLPPTVAHPFSLLPKCGLDEQLVTDELLDVLATACRAVDGAVEVNEKWRCPSARVLSGLMRRGVTLVAGSDAHRTADVGRYTHLHEVLASL
ncbi:PHP domain-containing protein [Tessaracoccus antarcticus]|uniref:PHP domain-containing protein n=1 Tax=Tessaracoccus antarcticus TaxID=2479848 RepID=A0A3M0GSC0_9ACTN|nr:PHP domain-containing protein [Tessaracoccus antarcticus]RMB60206.1 PHP domain-containing protein [Tessaracoccus antarcticus]